MENLAAAGAEMKARCGAMFEYFGEDSGSTSSVHIFGMILQFVRLLSSAKFAYEKKHGAIETMLNLTSTLKGEVTIGDVVATRFGSGHVEALRPRDQVCLVRLTFGRAYLQIKDIVTIGSTVFTPFGKGTVRSRAEKPVLSLACEEGVLPGAS